MENDQVGAAAGHAQMRSPRQPSFSSPRWALRRFGEQFAEQVRVGSWRPPTSAGSIEMGVNPAACSLLDDEVSVSSLRKKSTRASLHIRGHQGATRPANALSEVAHEKRTKTRVPVVGRWRAYP